jgi:hypothetical protein
MEHEWLMPIVRTWMHIFLGIGVIFFGMVMVALAAGWLKSINDQIKGQKGR